MAGTKTRTLKFSDVLTATPPRPHKVLSGGAVVPRSRRVFRLSSSHMKLSRETSNDLADSRTRRFESLTILN